MQLTSTRHRETALPTRARRALGAFVSGVVLTVLAVLALVMIVAPAVMRAAPYTVLTGSMDPTMPPGSLVVTRPTPVEDIQTGDVITYQLRSGEPEVVTHRVIGTGWNATGDVMLVTKGDANDVADEPVRTEQVRGVVAYDVPYLGYLNTWVGQNRPDWVSQVIAGGLFVYALLLVISAVREKRTPGPQDDPTTAVPA